LRRPVGGYFGTRLGSYEVLPSIRAGGMGEVYPLGETRYELQSNLVHFQPNVVRVERA
jgi:hypothetical protein